MPVVPLETQRNLYRAMEQNRIFVQMMRRDRDIIGSWTWRDYVSGFLVSGMSVVYFARFYAYVNRNLGTIIEEVEIAERENRSRWNQVVTRKPSFADSSKIRPNLDEGVEVDWETLDAKPSA